MHLQRAFLLWLLVPHAASAKKPLSKKKPLTKKKSPTKKKVTGLESWEAAVEQHLAARKAAVSRPQREAYATLWWGDTTSRAFDGLKTMVQSVRTFDAHREFVIMTPVANHELNAPKPPPVDAGLLRVQRAFAPVVFERVPFLTIFRNPNTTCQSKALGGCAVGTATAYASSRKPQPKYDSYVYSYTKFALWNLTAFSKVLYIDNDVLVTQPLEDLWATPLGTRNLAAAALAIKARTFKGVSEPACNADGSIPKGTHSGRVKFNAGIHLIEPSAVLYQAIRQLIGGQWLYSFKTPCTSDQRYWNILLASKRMHCWPLSANCRDPQFIAGEAPPNQSAPVSKLSRCLESAPLANGTRLTMPAPYMVHMACTSKPWLPKNARTYFAVEWHQQLARANQRLGLASETTIAAGPYPTAASVQVALAAPHSGNAAAASSTLGVTVGGTKSAVSVASSAPPPPPPAISSDVITISVVACVSFLLGASMGALGYFYYTRMASSATPAAAETKAETT